MLIHNKIIFWLHFPWTFWSQFAGEWCLVDPGFKLHIYDIGKVKASFFACGSLCEVSKPITEEAHQISVYCDWIQSVLHKLFLCVSTMGDGSRSLCFLFVVLSITFLHSIQSVMKGEYIHRRNVSCLKGLVLPCLRENQ